MTESILLTRDGHVATLTLNQPERHNALGAEQLAAIVVALDEVRASHAVRVLVVTGTGDKTFCAGAALDELGGSELTENAFQGTTAQIAALPIPTICAVNGNVFGGGVELALACDFRIGVEGARMQVPAAAIGLCYPLEGIRRFLEVLGPQIVRRLLVGAETFHGEAMREIGFLDQLVPRTELADATNALAGHIASLAPLAVQAMNQVLRQATTDHVDVALARELAQRCLESADLQEGLKAKAGKRAPEFRGR
ncbi:MAG: enoyl-CoA hydratase/isomerase family protein [Halioglobus sp.]|nr:enoyl-CoA hydratase/isomerase family protein [Halioglobus sp.]